MDKMTSTLKFQEVGCFDFPVYPKHIFKESVAKYLEGIPQGEHGRLIETCRPVTDAEVAFENSARGYTQSALQRLLQQYSALDETKDNVEGEDMALDYALFKNKCSRAVSWSRMLSRQSKSWDLLKIC